MREWNLNLVERLAFQAGVTAGGHGGAGATVNTKAAVHPLLRKLAKIGRDFPTNVGIALYSSTVEANITWEEIAALGKEVE